jgi:hypothetical protein
VRALRKFETEARRARAGQAPDADERALVVQLQAQLEELSHDESLSPDLRDALRDTATTLRGLLEPPNEQILDWAPGGGI